MVSSRSESLPYAASLTRRSPETAPTRVLSSVTAPVSVTRFARLPPKAIPYASAAACSFQCQAGPVTSSWARAESTPTVSPPMSAATGARSPSVARSASLPGWPTGRSCSRPPPSITATLERTSTVSSSSAPSAGLSATCSAGTRTSPTPPIASTVPPTVRSPVLSDSTASAKRDSTRPSASLRPVHFARCSRRRVPEVESLLRSACGVPDTVASRAASGPSAWARASSWPAIMRASSAPLVTSA